MDDDERDRRYLTHRIRRDAAAGGDEATMIEALRAHLAANEERILVQISALEQASTGEH